MFSPEHGGGSGGGDPWNNHPLVVKIREQVDRYERAVDRMMKVAKAMEIAGKFILTASVIFAATALLNWWVSASW